MNRKKFVLAWLGIIVVAAAAAAATHWAVCGRRALPAESMPEGKYLAQELGLNPGQAQAVGRLQAEVAAQLADCCARHCAARAELGRALGGGADSAAIIKAMSRAYEDSELAMWAHIQQVRALLTPAQQARYDALVERCVGGACNMPGGATGR